MLRSRKLEIDEIRPGNEETNLEVNLTSHSTIESSTLPGTGELGERETLGPNGPVISTRNDSISPRTFRNFQEKRIAYSRGKCIRVRDDPRAEDRSFEVIANSSKSTAKDRFIYEDLDDEILRRCGT